MLKKPFFQTWFTKTSTISEFCHGKILNFAGFLLESVSSSNFSSLIKLYCKIFGKLKTLFKPGIFISKLTSAAKVPQACIFNSEEAITDYRAGCLIKANI